MNGDDTIGILAMMLVLMVAGFALGKSVGDDYWHKSCNQYSLSAYAHKEVPARCVK